MIKHNDFNHLIIKLCLSKFKYIETKRASADRDIDLISSDALLVSHFTPSSIYACSVNMYKVIFKNDFLLCKNSITIFLVMHLQLPIMMK